IVGVEPTTSCMPCKRSSQLSYTPLLSAIAKAKAGLFFSFSSKAVAKLRQKREKSREGEEKYFENFTNEMADPPPPLYVDA
ncbi:MAG TPA: hypothetical protein PLI34_04955, partial [Saprospiraceae bacterium]|nr:hypothetical protein [Saprospiraceae bacterium]